MRSMLQKKITFSDTKSTKKRKSARPKTSSKKSSNTSSDKKSSKDARPLKIPIDNISLNAFFTILRSMVDLFTRTQPKEVSINGYNMINAEFIALKDLVLNYFTSISQTRNVKSSGIKLLWFSLISCDQYQI
ncbi:hypothetical protein F8M41_017929 [Gigaspora margarita]|uniref:Uncharacterized protein n=1 Tax=Gigaspora margarita TaxID=4874 RepID=A0A8H4B2Q7_GIGMA|nr:hypothetical protein F8M41_017929 [Gigaspora margarita]